MDMRKASSASRPSDFDRFWDCYPTQLNRAQAKAAWDRIAPTPEQQEAFLGALTIEAGARARLSGRHHPAQTAAVWLFEHQTLGAPETVLTQAAHQLRSMRLAGFVPVRNTGPRSLFARAMELVLPAVFAVAMAAMLLHGWTAP